MYTVRFYETQRGGRPVEEFIGGLDLQTKAKCLQLISLLEEQGPLLKRPFADKLSGKVYELRPKQGRLLYFFYFNREIVMLHGFLKKTRVVPRGEIEIAVRRMIDWVNRHG